MFETAQTLTCFMLVRIVIKAVVPVKFYTVLLKYSIANIFTIIL